MIKSKSLQIYHKLSGLSLLSHPTNPRNYDVLFFLFVDSIFLPQPPPTNNINQNRFVIH